MFQKKKVFQLFMVFSLMIGILACSLFTGAPKSTATSEPTLTHIPTDTPSQPLEIETVVPTLISSDVDEGAIDVNPVPPGELGVAMVHAYKDDFDSWVVAGLLLNNTDHALDDIEIEISALDLGGATLYSELVYASLYSLGPGEMSPFSTWVWEDLPGVQEFMATIVGFSPSDVEQAEVEVRGTLMSVGDGNVHITGELFNPKDIPIQVNNIAAATFDSDGQLVTAGAEVVGVSYLDPGESGPFRITMDTPGDDSMGIVDFSVYTNVEETYEEDLYDISYLEVSDYYDSDGDYHLVGELQNNSDVNLSISLLAAIFDAAGNVLDADDQDLPVYSIGPGERMFFDFDEWYPLNTVDGLSAQADTYIIETDRNWTWETDTTYVDMSVTDGGFEYDPFWGLTFTGKVVNNTGLSVNNGDVIVVLRDKDTDGLLAMGNVTLYDEIPAGGSADYEVLVEVESGFDLEEFEFVVIVKGELP